MHKVIYFGLPGRLCANWKCSALTGAAALVPDWLAQLAAGPHGFAFMIYDGSYWQALREWFKG